MRSALTFFLGLIFVCGCMPKPAPWAPPDGWGETDSTDGNTDFTDGSTDSTDSDTEAFVDEKDSVDNDAEPDKDVQPDKVDEDAADNGTDSADSDTDSADNKDADETPELDMKPDEPEIVDVQADEITDQQEAPDAQECPPGYSWDPEEQKCVSFCPADQYLEPKLAKCLYYPACDLSGTWKLSVLDSDTMNFTIYDLYLGQTVSHFEAFIEITMPPDSAECSGTLQKSEFVLNCNNEVYSLLLSSSTVEKTAASDGKFSGFYTYTYKAGGVKQGPFNAEKK